MSTQSFVNVTIHTCSTGQNILLDHMLKLILDCWLIKLSNYVVTESRI